MHSSLIQRGVRRSLTAVSAAIALPTQTLVSYGSGAARGATLPPLRFAATTTDAAGPSAVNMEAFTLNDEVVQRDLSNLATWNTISEAISAARTAGNYTDILAIVAKGLALLNEIGAGNAPVMCETLLCMEAVQAHYGMENYADALANAERAKKPLMDAKPAHRDMATVAEINVFIGHILCKLEKPTEAHAVVQEVLQWIDGDAKKATPMQAVDAVNLRRSALSGMGECLNGQAKRRAALGEDARETYGKALDYAIDSLNEHIDAKDIPMVKRTLLTILESFEGLGDKEQAVDTCRKFTSWCTRHEDAAGVTQGMTLLSALCEKYNMPVPTE